MADNPLDIRPVTLADVDLVRNVAGAVYAQAGLADTEAALGELGLLPTSFREHQGEFWVVRVQGTVVATGGVRRGTGRGEWVLSHVCVLPAWRGMGIGRMIVDAATGFAAEQGAARITAALPASLFSGAAFLLHLGFATAGIDELPEEPRPLQLRLDVVSPGSP